MGLTDSFNRDIYYLRVSVTDRCNFRCIYCMPETGAPIAPRHELLNDNELVRLVHLAISLGMTHIRITGGEPLVRPGLVSVLKDISSHSGLSELSITTNGFLLADVAADLAAAGVQRVNMSLDTLRDDRFSAIARRGSLKKVLDGLDAALEAGLAPVKINCVVMRGYNDDECVDFAALTLDRPLHIRFIELMPISWSAGDEPDLMRGFYALAGASRKGVRQQDVFAATSDNSFSKISIPVLGQSAGMLNGSAMRRAFVSAHETRSAIEATFDSLESAEVATQGPAQTYRIPGAIGTIGFISQVTRDFCRDCNRLRLTADGALRPCLMADGEVSLRDALRQGASDSDLADLFRLVVKHKPLEHRLEDGVAPVNRGMSQLGG